MRMTKELKEQMDYLLNLACSSAANYMYDDEIEDFDYTAVINEMFRRLKLN